MNIFNPLRAVCDSKNSKFLAGTFIDSREAAAQMISTPPPFSTPSGGLLLPGQSVALPPGCRFASPTPLIRPLFPKDISAPRDEIDGSLSGPRREEF